MASKILIKRSTTAGEIPTTSDLDTGELAINTADRRIFTNNSGTIVELGSTPSTLDITGNVDVGGTFDVVGAVTVDDFTATGNVVLTGAVTTVAAPTADNHAATKLYVDTEINDILDGAPAALDTLNEIAAAINDDADLYGTLNTAIQAKVPLAGGTMTGNLDMGANAVLTTADPTTVNHLARKGYVDTILGSATSAATSATAAATSASNAATSESNASTSETNAGTQATNAANSASAAATSATAASNSATSASNSASTATTKATEAGNAKTAAETAQANAETAETNAETAQTAAETAQTAAETAKTGAETAQTAAETAETNASASASAAATSATNAANSATNAATSATNASGSASTASTKATEAATSASNAAAAYDNFDDRWLGDKASDPSTDNDGDALLTGAVYYNTTDNALKIYNGSSWSGAVFDTDGALFNTNNLSDVSNVTTARDNLELGTSDAPTFAEVNVNCIDLATDHSPSHAEGRIFYDNTNDALAVYNSVSDITLQVGQEEYIRVYNNSGATITNGTPVYITGSSNEVPTIEEASASTEATSQAVGLATHAISNQGYGFVTVRGLVGDLDTSSFSVGDRVHVAPTAGDLQVAAPTYPYFPVDMGIVLVSHASNGCVYVDVQSHNFEELRITNNARVDNDLTVGGDLTVLGTQTVASTNNVSIGSAWNYFNSGDTIGEANTTFTGSGLDDGTLTGHYEGTTSNRGFYVAIDGVGTGTGGVDTFKWSHNSDLSSPEATTVDITGSAQDLAEGISITFGATTGHTSGDKWGGTASPINVDTGIASNRNTGGSGVGYTHVGLFFDSSDEKWKFFSEYDPEPEGTINTAHASFDAGTVVAGTFEGDVDATNITFGGTAITATGAELNFMDGVTSNVQTQLGTKLAKAGGTMTGVFREKQVAVTANTASTTLDFDDGNDFKVNISANTTFTFDNPAAGQRGVIYIVQDATGGRTFVLPSIAKTPKGGASISQSTDANGISILSYTVLDANNVLVNYIGDFE